MSTVLYQVSNSCSWPDNLPIWLSNFDLAVSKDLSDKFMLLVHVVGGPYIEVSCPSHGYGRLTTLYSCSYVPFVVEKRMGMFGRFKGRLVTYLHIDYIIVRTTVSLQFSSKHFFIMTWYILCLEVCACKYYVWHNTITHIHSHDIISSASSSLGQREPS